MKLKVKCIACQKEFWSGTYKRKVFKEDGTSKIVREPLKNLCRSCENRLRQSNMKRSPRLREIPEKFKKQITMRELHIAELERRKKKDKTGEKNE